jgi:Domain of unkown function (DUF1775)
VERRLGQRDAGLLRGRRGELAVKLALLVLVATVAGVLTPAAAGHSIVLPFSSRPGDLQLYTVVVPTETDSATREVALKVPEGIDFLLVKETPGWKVEVEHRNDRIDVVRWTGSAGPDQFAEFRLIARNPVLEGDLPWKITQTYANGETARWIGARGSEFPASVTRLSESAEPVDVATGLNGGGASSGGTTATEAAGDEIPTASAGGGSSDTPARVGAAVALALSLIALAGILITRRRATADR